jgi:biopolymer transport protein ExbD
MAIREPGYKPVRSRLQTVKRSRRTIAATLSLTAMVDLFTVLTVFLLQNYNVTGVALHIPKEVILPSAVQSEELEPATTVTITKDDILVGNERVAGVKDVIDREEWLIEEVRKQLRVDLDDAKKKAEKTGAGENYRNVTVQADRELEFSIIKKVMYTATESGAGEVSFAVLKEARE